MLSSEPQTCSHGTLCCPFVLAQVDTHRGKMVEVLSRCVLARHRWRVSDLLPLIVTMVHGVSHGGTVLVLVHGAGRAQWPRLWLRVQPLSRSLQGARGDAEETPRGSPPPRPVARFRAAPPRGDKGLGSGLQPPAPLPKKGFFPIPTCLCCFSSFFSFSFSSFSLWQSSLEARSWEQGGLVQSPPYHPLCPWGEGCCNALWECPHQSPPSDPQERGRKRRQMKGDAVARTSSSKTTSLAFLSPFSPYSEMGTGAVTLGMSPSDIPRVDTVLPVLLVAPSAAHLVVGDDQLLLQLFQLLLQLFLLLIHPLPVTSLPLEVLFKNLHLAGGRDVGEPG